MKKFIDVIHDLIEKEYFLMGRESINLKSGHYLEVLFENGELLLITTIPIDIKYCYLAGKVNQQKISIDRCVSSFYVSTNICGVYIGERQVRRDEEVKYASIYKKDVILYEEIEEDEYNYEEYVEE